MRKKIMFNVHFVFWIDLFTVISSNISRHCDLDLKKVIIPNKNCTGQTWRTLRLILNLLYKLTIFQRTTELLFATFTKFSSSLTMAIPSGWSTALQARKSICGQSVSKFKWEVTKVMKKSLTCWFSHTVSLDATWKNR